MTNTRVSLVKPSRVSLVKAPRVSLRKTYADATHRTDVERHASARIAYRKRGGWLAPLRTAAVLALALLAVLGSSPTAPVEAAPKAKAKAVSLADARFEPTVQRTIESDRRATLRCEGGGRPSDVGAYRENGDALSAQKNARTAIYWEDTQEGGSVKYTRATRQFKNNTARPVIVAIWCE